MLGRNAGMVEAPAHARFLTSIAPRTIIHIMSSGLVDGDVDRNSGGEGDGAWASMPLCRVYSVTYAGRVPVHVAHRGGRRPGSILWMLGWLSTGEAESLGAWSGPHDSNPDWASVLAGLELRGVQRVGIACVATNMPNPACVSSGIQVDACIEGLDDWLAGVVAQAIGSNRLSARDWRREVVRAQTYEEAQSAFAVMARSLWASRYPEMIDERRAAIERVRQLWTLRPVLRREVLSGDGTVAAVSQSLRRSVARHGSFSDQESALAFVRQAVDRALRRRALRSDEAVTEHNHHRVGFSPRMTALGV